MDLLTAHERRLLTKKKYYDTHKESILASLKEKYDAKKQERIAAGILPGKRGRKKKYLSDEEILEMRSEKLTES
jgi:hypothetical protein